MTKRGLDVTASHGSCAPVRFASSLGLAWSQAISQEFACHGLKSFAHHWQHHQDRLQTLLLLSPVRRARRLVMMRLAAVGLAGLERTARSSGRDAHLPPGALRAAQHPFTTTCHLCFAERWRHCHDFLLTCAVVAHSYCLRSLT